VLRLLDGGASLETVKSLLDEFFGPRCKLAGEHVSENLTGAPLGASIEFGGSGSALSAGNAWDEAPGA